MKIMVTGSAGFIGCHLARYLLVQGHEVVLVDNLARGRQDKEFEALVGDSNATFCNIDLTLPNAFDRFGDDIDQVYHLAAINGTENFYAIPDQVLRVNVLATLNLLEWAKSKPGTKLLISSSSETYAGSIKLLKNCIPSKEDIPLCIDDITNVRWSYGASKLLGECAFYSYAKTHPGMRFSIVRYHNIYGPRMGFEHVMPQFLDRIFKKELPLVVYGGKETRAFCYVSDAVEATMHIMNSDKADGQIVHVGNGDEEIEIGDLALLMLEMCGESKEISVRPSPPGSVMRRCPDVGKLASLGFLCRVSLREGLAQTIPWYRDHAKIISANE